MFVQSDAFTNKIQLAIESALRDAATFDFTPGVTVEWSAPAGGSRITVSFTGQKTLTTVLGEDVVGRIHIALTLDLSVPATDQIRLDIGFSFDVAIAGIDVSFIARFIAESLISGLVGSTFSASAVLGDGDSPLGPLADNIQCVITGTSSLSCQGSALPSSGGSLAGDLRDTLGLAEGIIFMGSGAVNTLLPDSQPQLEFTAFRWIAPPHECSGLKDFIEHVRNPKTERQTIFGALLAEGSVAVTNTLRGSRPLMINDVHILDDTAPGLYSKTETGAPNRYIVYANCRYPTPTFFANPYPCVLAIYTTAGVKLAKLDAPPALADAEVRQMVDGSTRDAVAQCEKLMNPWSKPFLNPEWLVDPSPELGAVSYGQIWEFEVPASSLGGTVAVIMGNNQAEVRTVGSPGRSVSASFLTKRGEGLQLRFRESAGTLRDLRPAGAVNSGDAHLGLIQTLLCKAADLSLGRALKGVVLVAAGSGPLLAAGLRSGLSLYDVSAPSNPVKVIGLPLDGLIGLAEGPRGQILAWGDFGMIAIQRRGTEFITAPLVDSPVQTATILGNRWFASTMEGIVVLDCELQRERCISQPRGLCGCLCSLPHHLLWITGGDAFQSSSCGSQWTPVASEITNLPYCFETVRVGRTPYLFAPRDNGGGSLWTLNGGRLAIVSEFDQDPWFRRSACLPKMFVTADRDGVTSIYSVAGRAVQ